MNIIDIWDGVPVERQPRVSWGYYMGPYRLGTGPICHRIWDPQFLQFFANDAHEHLSGLTGVLLKAGFDTQDVGDQVGEPADLAFVYG